MNKWPEFLNEEPLEDQNHKDRKHGGYREWSKGPDESYFQSLIRHASQWGLETEVTYAFCNALKAGDDEFQATMHALWEWDIA